MGDVLEDLRSEGHLSARQHRAMALFLRDLQANHGTSEGVVGLLAERVQSSTRSRLWPPGGSSGGLAALDALLYGLRPHERRLVAFLVKHREEARGTLSDFGRVHSGYKTPRTTRAVAIGRIGALLDTLADEYLGPEAV
jgi:hypothetical protein